MVFTGGMDAAGTNSSGLVSGEAVELELRVARIGSRAIALLLDVAAQAILLVILITAMVIFLLYAGYAGILDSALATGLMITMLVIVLIGYPVCSETLSGGRSLGKLAMGLRVVRDDGGPIQFRHSLTRSLVGVALEWPGVLMPLATWAVSLGTMLVNPQGKRLGDLAAGTLVIHDRNPATWGWVPAAPPQLAPWASTLDLTGLDDDLALAVRHYLSRNRRIAEPMRTQLGRTLAAEVAARTRPAPPRGVPGWMYLAAVLAERHRRSARRLAGAREASARVWPSLHQVTTGIHPDVPAEPQIRAKTPA